MIDTAVILAGGLGTRLRPLTDEIPKPLLPIKGKPILLHVINNLKRYGIVKIILSISYKHEKVQEFFGDGCQFGVIITYSVENEPLGTGGAVREAVKDLQESVFVVWGDNLMDLDYKKLFETYTKYKSPVTMVLTPRNDVENFGVATLEGSKVISFVEKPKREEAPSNLINAGAIVLEPQIIKKMLPQGKSSIEYDFYEKLKPGEIVAHIHEGQWYPTDKMETYREACEKFKQHLSLEEKKVIIADVDGTIVESCQVISSEMADIINCLIKKGKEIVFISGAPVSELQRMISSRLTQNHHLLGNTGTQYTIIKNGKIKEIYNHSLSETQKQEIMTAFENILKEYNIQTLTTKEDQLQDRGSQITLSALGRGAPSELKKNFDPTGAKRLEWAKALTKLLGEDKYEIKVAGTTSIDVTKKGLDKEWGIREFVKQRGVFLKDILFFGDKIFPGGNDYPASKIVDSVAVSSPEETKGILKLFLDRKNEQYLLL